MFKFYNSRVDAIATRCNEKEDHEYEADVANVFSQSVKVINKNVYIL